MSIFVFVSAILLMTFEKNRTLGELDNSELNARNRYSIAEKIRKEFEEKKHHIL